MTTRERKRTTESNSYKLGTSQIREGTTVPRIARWTLKPKTRVQSNLARTFLSREKRDIAITFVCLSVCLFVCLLAGFLINYWSDFDETW